MKARNIFTLFAAAAMVMLTGCEQKSPFETISADDNPRILTPYNESGTNTFTYTLDNPDTHLVDSCLVTPSTYTTVNWYVDKQLIQTGLKIDQNFLAGHYDLLITATTTKGKTASRYGTVTVMPYAEDPYSEDPKAGRHVAPDMETELNGDHLDLAEKVLITTDLFAVDQSQAISPTYKEEKMFKFMVPQLADGKYFVRFIDAEGKVYGADHLNIHNGPVALDGYKEFTMEKPCTVTGLNLQAVTSVTVGGVEVTPTAVTANSVTFVAPKLEEEGFAPISMQTDGGAVQFLLEDGTYADSYESKVLAKKLIIVAEGPINVGCNGDPDWTAKVIDGGFDWSGISAGQVMFIVAHRDAGTTDYNNFKVMTNDWSWSAPDDGNFEFGDGVNEKVFTYTVTAGMISSIIEKGGLCAAGHGTVIDRIYFEAPDETVLLQGNYPAAWDAEAIQVPATDMAAVPEGATIFVYYTLWPSGAPEFGGGDEYYNFRVIGPWWGPDIVAQIDLTDATPNPYEILYTAEIKNTVETQGALCCVGWGYSVTKITWK